MKPSRYFVLLLLLLAVKDRAVSARQSNASPATAPSGPDDPAKRADAYYDFVMGHYYAQQYEISSHAEDATKSIDFYKKAYALDPANQQIGDELAEIYFQSQHIRDAVTEAQSMLAKDPDNVGARRLLARIY